ncbi:hypothetical protein C8R46DRAFT_1109176 [Mycena filopes]|nr:hypothetical protein C8R46DRAFT_1109176 [Mycena filopes]
MQATTPTTILPLEDTLWQVEDMEAYNLGGSLPPSENMQRAHVQAARLMSRLPQTCYMSEDNHRRLQDFHHKVEQCYATFAMQDYDDDNEYTECPMNRILLLFLLKHNSDADMMKDVMAELEFLTFKMSLEPENEATPMLAECINRAITACETLEEYEDDNTTLLPTKSQDALDVAFDRVVKAHERIRSHEASLHTGGVARTPVSWENIQIYRDLTTDFEAAVQTVVKLLHSARSLPTVTEHWGIETLSRHLRSMRLVS